MRRGFINPKLQRTLGRKSPFIALWLCSQRNHIENAVLARGKFSIKRFLEHGVPPLRAHHWARPRLAVGACVG